MIMGVITTAYDTLGERASAVENRGESLRMGPKEKMRARVAVRTKMLAG